MALDEELSRLKTRIGFTLRLANTTVDTLDFYRSKFDLIPDIPLNGIRGELDQALSSIEGSLATVLKLLVDKLDSNA